MTKMRIAIATPALLGGAFLIAATRAQDEPGQRFVPPEGNATNPTFPKRGPARPSPSDFERPATRAPYPVQDPRFKAGGPYPSDDLEAKTPPPMKPMLVPGPPLSKEEIAVAQATREALRAIRSAKTEEEKQNAARLLALVLAKAFDRDLERREKEVSEIEGRVRKLRDQVEKRRKAKDEIVNLRLRTIVNEAEGLGFPGSFDLERPQTPVPPAMDPFSPRPVGPVPVTPTPTEPPRESSPKFAPPPLPETRQS